MFNSIFKFSKRTFMGVFEIMAVAALLLLLAGGLLVWRLSSGPLDVSFAREYIEDALYDPESQTSISVGSVVVEWPVLKEPLQLSLERVRLRRAGRNLISVRSAGLGISAPPLLLGRVEPVSIILNRPVLRLTRTADNGFELNMKSDYEADEIIENDEGHETLSDMIEVLSRPEGEGNSVLASLDHVVIKDAAVAIEDHIIQLSWYLQDMDLAFGRDEKGLAINASIAVPGGRDGTATMRMDAVYARQENSIHFNLNVRDLDPSIFADKIEELSALRGHDVTVSGDISGILHKDMQPVLLNVNLRSDNGALNLKDIYDKPLLYQTFAIEASYDAEKGAFSLPRAEFLINEIPITLEASALIQDGKIEAPVKISLPHIAHSQIAPLWPDVLRGDGAETWIVHKLSGGSASNLDANLTIMAEQKEGDDWSIDVKDITGRFDVTNMDIDYRNPLTPVTGANGSGEYKDGNLQIEIASGKLGDMDIKGGKVLLDNVADARNGTALIEADLNGPLKNLFSYIAKEPISMGPKELGINGAGVAGDAALGVRVSFPMIKDLLAEQVKVEVDAKLNNILLPDVVKKLSLTGGPFDLKVKDGAVRLSGAGKLHGRDIEVDWHQYLDSEGKPYSSQTKASMIADDELRAALGINISDWVSGPFKTSIVYTEQGGGKSLIDVHADIAGGTLMVKPFRYTKPASLGGTVDAVVALKDGFVEEVRSLNVQSQELKITDGLLSFAKNNGESDLRKGLLPAVKLLENDLNVDFEIEANGLVRINAKGPFMDGQPFITEDPDKKGAPKTPYDGPAIIASIKTAQMRTGPDQTVKNVNLVLNMAKDGTINQMEMDAFAGKGDIYLRLMPNEFGRQALRLEADDAGAALKAFGIYKNVQGGKMIVDGQAPNTQTKRLIEGKAQLTDFRVVNAPVLARLVNSLSLPGILDLLNNDGINFTKLESDFAWEMRPLGHIYTIKNGRTSGASMGLNFEGTINKETGLTNITGTIVPASALNTLVGNIPLVGEILAGGKGGALIAATYSIKGPVEDPDVSVNPLSALAPGILRRIFFEE